MSVFSNYARQVFKGPAFGGSKANTVIIAHCPMMRYPVLGELPAYLTIDDAVSSSISNVTMKTETYHYSRHGFWYLDTLGENEARKRFVEGTDVEAWADDDA